MIPEKPNESPLERRLRQIRNLGYQPDGNYSTALLTRRATYSDLVLLVQYPTGDIHSERAISSELRRRQLKYGAGAVGILLGVAFVFK